MLTVMKTREKHPGSCRKNDVFTPKIKDSSTCRIHVIDRPKLSRRLLEESGAQSIHGSVTDVWLLGDICSITLADGRVIRSRYVIGADGAFSAVRKGVFRTRPEIFTPMEEHISEDPTEDVFEFDIGQEFGGAYRWLFPCGSGRTVGSVSGMGVPDIRERGLHRFIPSGCVPEPVKGNVFLIGDAAGFPNRPAGRGRYW